MLLLLVASSAVTMCTAGKTQASQTGEQKVEDLDWWQRGVIYQIYPRSFKDSNADGVGDLSGIAEHADYLKSLGIAAVWLSPIYESPQADFGYDVSDFRKIDMFYGTLEDFKQLRDALHSRGMKLLLDFIPNHTSDQHEWFEKSVQNIQPYADYYVWKEGRFENETRLPPNNWLSFFEGSAWTWNEKRQKYYLHQYLDKQPDLNYRNPHVLREMKEIMKFWLDAGVDGFRMDSVHTMVEDDRFLDEPRSFISDARPTNILYLDHIYTQNQPENFEVLRQFRELLDKYTQEEANMTAPCNSANENCTVNRKSSSEMKSSTKVMFSEAYTNIKDTMRYYGNETHPSSHFPFNFLFITDLDTQSNAQDFLRVINTWYSNMPEGKWANWVVGNHDNNRIASRFGPELADGIQMIQFILPGTCITYHGDEIAMENTFIRWDETQDPYGLQVGKEHYLKFSRDGERTPFLWDNSLSAGFSTSSYTWLPVNPNFYRTNLEFQMEEERSHFKIYKKLLELKKKRVIQFGSLNMKAVSRQILMIERADKANNLTYVTVVNIGSYYEFVDLTELLLVKMQNLTIYVSSVNSIYAEGADVSPDRIRLRPKEALILTNEKLDLTQK